jgi:hypothetical protein
LVVVHTNANGTVPLPANAPLEITFNRALNPSTIVRQTVQLRDSSGVPTDPPVMGYDPVSKRVSISSSGSSEVPWLKAGQFYKVLLATPTADGKTAGIRAIDGASISTETPREFGFFVHAPSVERREGEWVGFCDHVLPVLRVACGSAQCHGSNSPADSSKAAMGLLLDSREGLQRTALSKVARTTNHGPRSGKALPFASDFPRDMPIIDPGNASNSYLLYKVLLAVPGNGFAEQTNSCAVSQRAPRIPAAAPWTEEERQVLGNLLGTNAMPLPHGGPRSLGLSVNEMEVLRVWISQGAATEDCPLCPPLP